jgi:glyoxylase-like metal-dependent hydrolase (beta-lactamase superfamily II)
MKVRILGAHNLELQQARHTCFLVDDVIAIDAGSLMTTLSLEELKNIQVILLTHRHFDHVRDLPSLGLATIDQGGATLLYGLPETLEAITSRLMDGMLYPDFTTSPSQDKPRYQLQPVTPGETLTIYDYIVRAIAVPHTAPTVGYIIHQPGGSSFAYCGDTGGGLLPFFQDPLRPDPIFVEVTFPERMKKLAKLTAHLTPDLLRREITTATNQNAFIPRIRVVHRSPEQEEQIAAELTELAAELGVEITLAWEDKSIDV